MMKPMLFVLFLTILFSAGCNTADTSASKKSLAAVGTTKKKSLCSDVCKAKSKSGELVCKLTTPELQRRKETVLASLKVQIQEKKETEDGYAFRFPGTDEVLDELTEFIKTERVCCDFFTFSLSVSGDQSEAWLELSGEEGVKDFIATELGLTN